LADLGNPYTAIGWDFDGRVAIDWGVYGVPETFVVDRTGTIRFKHVGPITPEILDRQILPLVERLRRAS
ncbi:MAG: DsbE family thiol:disulfide interchange protein, partial [Tagaea sp.]